MRRNVTQTLDGIGLLGELGIRDSDELFADGFGRLHATSAGPIEKSLEGNRHVD